MSFAHFLSPVKAYFINGRRDILLERNFKTMIGMDNKLKVFTKVRYSLQILKQ